MKRFRKWFVRGLIVCGVLAAVLAWLLNLAVSHKTTVAEIVVLLWNGDPIEEDALIRGGSGWHAPPPGSPSFFHPNVLIDFSGRLQRDWLDVLTLCLWSFKEPLLSGEVAAKDCRGFRFTWLRSFYPPVCVRLSLGPDGEPRLVAKRTNNMRIVECVQDKQVSRRTFDRMEKLAEDCGFWSMTPCTGDYGVDGADWFLEGVRHGKYRVVHRWSPGRESEFRKACEEFLALGGVRRGPIF